MRRLGLAEDGAELKPGAAYPILHLLDAMFPPGDCAHPGARLFGVPGLGSILESGGLIGELAKARLGPAARPVRALLFNKSASANWGLGWHQDRTIAVKARLDGVQGYSRWGAKGGVPHVEPPFSLLEGMVTIRVHLDAAGPDNAPLLIAPGSHKLGRIPEAGIEAAVSQCGQAACLAAAGDVWIYATPILHASARSSGARRRVLQAEYAAADLPGGLEWAGV